MSTQSSKLDSQAKKSFANLLASPANPKSIRKSLRIKNRRTSLTESPDNLVQITPGLVVRKRGRSLSEDFKEGEPTSKASKMDDLKIQLG